MAAAAIAPLSFMCFKAADAQTLTISNNTSTPVSTATAVSGGPGDILINSGATFSLQSPGTAVTVNSNNSVSTSGTFQSKNINDVTAILVQPGGFTGSIANGGEINLTEDFTPSDSVNSDGIAEAPFAQGSGRIGIHLAGPLTGSLSNSGSIDIQGNNSAGIAIDSGLNGALVNTGAVNMVGNNSVAIRTGGEITGAVQITGAISVKGAASAGVQTTGPIDGAFSIYSGIQTTGYSITIRETGTNVLQKIEATPADVQQGGSAVQIGGSVLGGVFLGAPPITTVAGDTTTDADGDGIVDTVEGTAALTTFGSAPALAIGSANPITLGAFGTGGNAFGLIIRGTVTGQGIFDGVTSTAIDIGQGGGGVNIAGGILIAGGAVTSASFQADSTAIHLESGVVTPSIQNAGTISASVTSAGGNTATAIQIDQGAHVTSLINAGLIAGVVTGDKANATAVVDNTGDLNSVVNIGAINATLNPGLPGEAVTGTGIALDLQHNTTGVTLTQQSDADGVAPSIVGDIYLGSGPNTVQFLAGTVNGALSMGGAASSLTIDNGATYTGALSYSGNQLAINVANGRLQQNAANTIGASSLNVGASSSLIVALDPANNKSAQFNVSGAATFAAGSKIGATLLSTPQQGGQSFTIVHAGSLDVGGVTDQALLTSMPYLFDGNVHADTGAGTITINVRTKSTAELGMNKAETAAFNAIYAALPQDSGIQTAIVSATTREGLISSYDQLLPNSSGDVFETARGMTRAVSRASSERFDLSNQQTDEDEEEGVTSGFWASEFYSGIDQQKADNNAYHSAALGVIGGYDFGGTGFTLMAGSSNVTRPNSVGDSLNSVSVVEGGLYAEPRFGPVMIDARVGAGYLKVSDRRQFVASVVSGDLSTVSTVTRSADGDWSGYELSAHLGAGLQFDVSKHLFFQPRVYADIFHLHENAYNERNGGAGYDFNVSERNGTQTNGVASLVTGLRFGTSFVFSPQLEIGYDDVVQGGPGSTTARFAYGGPTFTVPANQVGGAGMARVTLRGDGNFVHFSLQAGGEYNDNYRNLDLKAVFRMTF